MQISLDAIQKILGINEDVPVTPEEMAKMIRVTFYPWHNHKVSNNIVAFSEKLRSAFLELGVEVVPYDQAFGGMSLKRKLKIILAVLMGKMPKGVKIGKKIKEGIAVITLGEGLTGKLAMDNIMGFAKNTVITILDMPEGIDSETEFHKHFDTAMNLFAYHMTNIAIVVNEKIWIPYNFNASHPVYTLQNNFKEDILKGLIPKIAAPIKPPKLREFTVLEDRFDPYDTKHKKLVDDFLENGTTLEKTGLYPPGKLLNDLPFRNEFYRWIGKIQLDDRNGMSFGFLARQMPLTLSKVLSLEELSDQAGVDLNNKLGEVVSLLDKDYLLLEAGGRRIALEIPEVWVITQRSGSKKTNINPDKDLLKMGIKSGRMLMQVPQNLELTPSYKPSFDTKVILAHAVANALIGMILKDRNPDDTFAKNLEENGMAIAHWHGYINPAAVPAGWSIFGENNLPVSCSTYQSAIFALSGKIQNFLKLFAENIEYKGDIHIEPHHGSNICTASLKALGDFLTHREDVSKLGNYYLKQYKQ